MKWKNIIDKINSKEAALRLNQPADVESIAMIQETFNVALPDELIDFYKETNGLSEIMEGMRIGDLIWSAERLMEENKNHRTMDDFKELYMPFDGLLFFGDAGNGDNFGYSIHNGVIRKTDIYAWNHEDDSRMWVAPNLETFVEWWKSGKIAI